MKKEEMIVELQARGQRLLDSLKKIIEEGNARKVVIRNKEGEKIATFRLTIGVVGALGAPILTAISAIVLAVSDCKVEIIKKK